ncbi:MAG: hypothetical protein CME69_07955 [Halobacteriovorax sp.]|nr:hypothetical protein [Halobacteriovorax sp.]
MTEQTYHIFLVVRPGLENITRDEILFKFPKLSSLKIEVVGGGLEIKEVPLNIIYTFQYYLKTVTRILLRIDSFKARDLPKLYKKAKKIPWNKYFIACTPDIHIKSSESRLFDDRKISKTIISAINDYQEANACKKKLIEEYGNKSQAIYVRILKDEVMMSYDCTGERMDLRGDKTHTTMAPIRASIASAMVQLIKNGENEYKTIFDPMCGSGTLIKEYINYQNRMQREFNLNNSPLFKDIKSLDIEINEPQKINFICSDIDEKAINATKLNLKEEIQRKRNISIRKEDFFTNDISTNEAKESLILLNPPYNKRIKYEQNPKVFTDKIKESLIKTNAKLICIIHPHKFKLNTYKAKHFGPINNGGIKTFISLLERK